MAQSETASSPLAEALARVGDRWTLLVVEALLTGPRRFNDLLDQIPGIAANILSERLKRLDQNDRGAGGHASKKLLSPRRVKLDFALELHYGFSIHARTAARGVLQNGLRSGHCRLGVARHVHASGSGLGADFRLRRLRDSGRRATVYKWS